LVYVSRVGDGICDCCDGSDEEVSGKRPCQNTCRDEGARLRAQREKQLADLRAGLHVKIQAIEEAKQQNEDNRQEIERLSKQLPALEEQLADLRKRKEEADAAKMQKECQTELPRLREKVKTLEAKIASLEAELAKGAETTATTTKKVVSEYAKWMEGADAALEEEEDEKDEQPPPPVEGKAPETKAEDDAPRSEEEEMLEKDLKSLETQVKADQELKARLEKELDELPEDKFGFASLRSKCLEHKTSEYTYKLCFFKDAKQSFTRLGSWSGFTGPSEALFKDGDMCYGGPARSLKVVFECGASEEVVDVSEPSRCTYQAVVRHAGACEEAMADEPGVRHPKDEL